jgi:hypothetical protein
VKLKAGTPKPSQEFQPSDICNEVAEEIRLGEALMDRYRESFRALAK